MLLYHGTDLSSATSLGAGAPLSSAAAASNHIDGESGFYLATEKADAEFFAVRRWIGSVIVYDLKGPALSALERAGAETRPIPGGCPPHFCGSEFFVPQTAFDVFNTLVAQGEIGVGL